MVSNDLHVAVEAFKEAKKLDQKNEMRPEWLAL